MEIRGIKLNIVIVVSLIVLLLFFVGQNLLKLYNVDKPLNNELMALQDVSDVEIKEDGNGFIINLTISPGSDFYNIYNEVEQITNKRLGKKLKEFKFKDDSAELQNEYYRLHYAIYEGIANKQFVTMESNIKELSKELNIDDYKLWVDSKAVYLQLNKANKNLYRRIPYIGQTLVVSAEGGGSSG